MPQAASSPTSGDPNPISPAPDPDTDDRIVKNGLRPRANPLDPEQPVPYGHVLLAAVELRWSPAAVVARLTALGYADIQLPEAPLPDAVGPDDLPLIKDANSHYAIIWLDITEPVSLQQILVSAVRTDRGPAGIARRLTALGYRIGGSGHPLPESFRSGDAVLIRTDPGIYGRWLDWDEEVAASHVLNVAFLLRRSPYATALRLLSLGIRLPYTPVPEDELLVSTPGTFGAGRLNRTAPTGHILAVAERLGRPPAEIAARLTELGYRHEAVPDAPEADDLTLLSDNVDGRAPWLEKNTVVGLPMRHILRAALVTGRTPADIAARLTALGHWLHADAVLPAVVDTEDIRLLAAVDRSYLDNVHLENVLRGASLTGMSPAEVARRLTALGHQLPDEVDYPDVRGSLVTP
ncbi:MULTISPECIES: hypothetical protein [unclassified Streptomyces]|uniref:wHTH domain-containing protein n=1 Tax=unclassified Streptomyces TaxID=2593676 RepID=UPI00380FA8C5